MAKLIFHPKNAASNKIKLGVQYRSLKVSLAISVITNLTLIILLVTTLI